MKELVVALFLVAILAGIVYGLHADASVDATCHAHGGTIHCVSGHSISSGGDLFPTEVCQCQRPDGTGIFLP
jgi:hypothetical protein